MPWRLAPEQERERRDHNGRDQPQVYKFGHFTSKNHVFGNTDATRKSQVIEIV
jgi:hypothetical protein